MATLFSSASNARRAARAAGHELSAVEIVQVGGKFRWELKTAEADTDEGQPEAVAPTSPEVEPGLDLVDGDVEVAPPSTDVPAAGDLPTNPQDEVAEAVDTTLTQAQAFAKLGEGLDANCLHIVSFVIERRTSAHAIEAARIFARKLGFDCVVRNTDGNSVAYVPAKAPKVARARKAPVGTAPKAPKTPRDPNHLSPTAALAVELASAAGGTTRAKMDEAAGKSLPWTQILKTSADRLGRKLTISKVDGRATYFLAP